MSARIGSLFSGSGMLDEGVRAVLGGHVAWHAEYEPPTEKHPQPTQAAARVLAYRYPGVPNLGDISGVDWSAVPPVDVLTGGFPCQDVSHAGCRAGMSAGTRSGLWARMCDAVEALRPSFVMIENVRGLTSAQADSAMESCAGCVGVGDDGVVLRALGRVLADLAELGYDAQWLGLPASDVGAPHERFRVFIVATDAANVGHERGGPARRRRAGSSDGDHASADAADGGYAAVRTCGHAQGQPQPTSDPTAPAHADRDALREQPIAERRGGRAAVAELDRQAFPDATGDGRREGRPEPARILGGPDAAQCCAQTLADPDGDGRPRIRREQPLERHTHRRDSADIAWGNYEPAIRRWEALTRPAPAPTETGTRGGQRLSRWFDEWMMGWPDGWVTDVPGITYREAIKICGNGVVPQQAAEALRRMLQVVAVAA